MSYEHASWCDGHCECRQRRIATTSRMLAGFSTALDRIKAGEPDAIEQIQIDAMESVVAELRDELAELEGRST